MNNTPKKLNDEMSRDPAYQICMRFGWFGHTCGGRNTREHSIIVAGKQLQKIFAILSICAKGHGVDFYQDGGDLDKEIHLWIALNRASDQELLEISKVIDYQREKKRLNAKYGVWYQKGINLGKSVGKPVEEMVINY